MEKQSNEESAAGSSARERDGMDVSGHPNSVQESSDKVPSQITASHIHQHGRRRGSIVPNLKVSEALLLAKEDFDNKEKELGTRITESMFDRSDEDVPDSSHRARLHKSDSRKLSDDGIKRRDDEYLRDMLPGSSYEDKLDMLEDVNTETTKIGKTRTDSIKRRQESGHEDNGDEIGEFITRSSLHKTRSLARGARQSSFGSPRLSNEGLEGRRVSDEANATNNPRKSQDRSPSRLGPDSARKDTSLNRQRLAKEGEESPPRNSHVGVSGIGRNIRNRLNSFAYNISMRSRSIMMHLNFQHEEDNKRLGNVWPEYIIHPDKYFNIFRQYMMSSFAVFTLVWLPTFLVMNINNRPAVLAINITIDMIYLMNIPINFFVALKKDKHGIELITDRTIIMKNYFSRDFWIDCIYSIPYDLIYVVNGQSGWGLELVRCLRLLRLKNVSVFNSSTNMGMLMRQVLVLFTVGHLSGCLWWGCAAIEDLPRRDIFKIYGVITTNMCIIHGSTVPQYVSQEEAGFIFITDRYSKSGESLIDFVQNYLYLLVWGMKTASSFASNIYPESVLESVLILFIVFVGLLMFAYVLGAIFEVISSISSKSKQYRDYVQEISQWFKTRNFDMRLRNRVLEYRRLEQQFYNGVNEVNLLDTLPDTLRRDITCRTRSPMIMANKLLRVLSSGFIGSLCNALCPEIFIAVEIIITAGEEGSKMFFIDVGQVDVIRQGSNDLMASLGRGDFFGEIAIIMGCPRTAHVQSNCITELFALHEQDLVKLLEVYPTFEKVLLGVADRRATELRSRKKKKIKVELSDYSMDGDNESDIKRINSKRNVSVTGEKPRRKDRRESAQNLRRSVQTSSKMASAPGGGLIHPLHLQTDVSKDDDDRKNNDYMMSTLDGKASVVEIDGRRNNETVLNIDSLASEANVAVHEKVKRRKDRGVVNNTSETHDEGEEDDPASASDTFGGDIFNIVPDDDEDIIRYKDLPFVFVRGMSNTNFLGNNNNNSVSSSNADNLGIASEIRSTTSQGNNFEPYLTKLKTLGVPFTDGHRYFNCKPPRDLDERKRRVSQVLEENQSLSGMNSDGTNVTSAMEQDPQKTDPEQERENERAKLYLVRKQSQNILWVINNTSRNESSALVEAGIMLKQGSRFGKGDESFGMFGERGFNQTLFLVVPDFLETDIMVCF